MKAMIVNEFGDSSVFKSTVLAKPELKPGHVLVRVVASSVNTCLLYTSDAADE